MEVVENKKINMNNFEWIENKVVRASNIREPTNPKRCELNKV
jgi:hypothetical protein